MLAIHRGVTLAALLVVSGIACNKIETTTDLQIQRMEAGQKEFGSYFTYMVDNAILRDMSVADIHFTPHTNELSGIGEARLERLAALLNVYGGTVRYETLIEDEDLIARRLAHAGEYLALVGCDMERVTLVRAQSGGRGLPGDEAVSVFRQGATNNESESDSTTFVPGILTQSEGQ